MFVKRMLAAVAVAAMLPVGHASAATDVAAAAQGTGTLKYTHATCSAPAAITINVRNNTAVVTENWGPGSPGIEACAVSTVLSQYEADNSPTPQIQQCVQGAGISTSPGYTLSQSGQAYTLQGSYRLCNGKNVVDKIVVTVQATRLIYSHTYSENGVAIITATANLPRVA